jgi:hypothetical protein
MRAPHARLLNHPHLPALLTALGGVLGFLLLVLLLPQGLL